MAQAVFSAIRNAMALSIFLPLCNFWLFFEEIYSLDLLPESPITGIPNEGGLPLPGRRVPLPPR